MLSKVLLQKLDDGVTLKTGITLTPPTDFKLLENNLVLICDEYNCRIGDFSASPKWDEYTFTNDLVPATGVSALFTKASVLNTRVIGKAKSTIVRYSEEMRVAARVSDCCKLFSQNVC